MFGLYERVTAAPSVPLVIYDNPGTARFTFTDELYSRVAELPNVTLIKIPGVPADADEAAELVTRLRTLLPPGVMIGVSGDPLAAVGLAAGCDVWYSVVGASCPNPR